MLSHYETLHVHLNADKDVIEAAYKALAKQFMPGANRNEPADLARMKAINEAWEVLGNPRRRAEYDQTLQASAPSMGRGIIQSEPIRPIQPYVGQERPDPPPPPVPPDRKLPWIVSGILAAAVVALAIILVTSSGEDDSKVAVDQTIDSNNSGQGAGLVLTTTPTLAPSPTPIPSAPPTLTPTPPPPTATPTPAIGELLYAADFSKGLSGWKASSDWKTLGDVLLNDGTGSTSGFTLELLDPRLTQKDFAIEAKFKVIRFSSDVHWSYGFVLRGNYRFGRCQFYPFGYSSSAPCPDRPSEVIALTGTRFSLVDSVNSRDGTLTLRAEIKGNRLRFLINGSEVLTTTDNKFLDNSTIGLWSTNTQLEITDLKIFAN